MKTLLFSRNKYIVYFIADSYVVFLHSDQYQKPIIEIARVYIDIYSLSAV